MTIYKVNNFYGEPKYFDTETNPNAEKDAQDYLKVQRAETLTKENVRFSICATFVDGNNTIWRNIEESDPEETICQVFDTFTGRYIECATKTLAYKLNNQMQEEFLDSVGLGQVYIVDSIPAQEGKL